MTMKSTIVATLLLFCAATSTVTVVVAWPNEFLPGDVQEGYEIGMAPEIEGLWLGDEKYLLEDGTIEPYCSRAIFNPQGYLTWESVPNSTCRDADAYPKTKRVEGNWFEKIQMPGYIYRFRQKTCLPIELCMEDVTQDDDPDDRDKFRDWTLEAKACGAHLKEDQLVNNTYTCESYQVSLISRPIDPDEDSLLGVGRSPQKEYLLVNTLSYHFFSDGWDQYSCPASGPSFLAENIAEPFDGNARFVLQSPFNSTAIYDPCTWDCFDDTLNDLFDCGGQV